MKLIDSLFPPVPIFENWKPQFLYISKRINQEKSFLNYKQILKIIIKYKRGLFFWLLMILFYSYGCFAFFSSHLIEAILKSLFLCLVASPFIYILNYETVKLESPHITIHSGDKWQLDLREIEFIRLLKKGKYEIRCSNNIYFFIDESMLTTSDKENLETIFRAYKFSKI